MVFVGTYEPQLVLVRGCGDAKRDKNDVYLVNMNMQTIDAYHAEDLHGITYDYAMAAEESTGNVYVHQDSALCLLRIKVDVPFVGLQVKLRQWVQHAKMPWSDTLLQFT